MTLADLGGQQALLVAALDIDERANFITLRQHVRDALAAASDAQEVTEIVTELLA